MTPYSKLATLDPFHRAEARAEWLIGVLRLGFSSTVALMLLLLLIGVGVPLSEILQRQLFFAMSAMSSYFMLGLTIVLVIRANKYQPWMAWFSALTDCAFILFGLWLSMENLGFGGVYIWSFPAVWLIPVILATGALRFNPALQATMVAVLVLGVLVILPASHQADIAEGAGALQYLFGGPSHLMRGVMVTLAGGVLIVASVQIRRLIRRYIDEAEARGRLTRFLPKQLEKRLGAAELDAMRVGTKQQMAVMFIDIRGFTSLSEQMDPGDVSSFLGAFRRCITEAADAHQGIVDKFIGDGALVVFEDGGGTAACRATVCAKVILEAVDAWRSDVQIGIGVHFGTVFAGVIGDEGRLEFTVLGDAVNVASRLETATKETGMAILVSEACKRAADSGFDAWVDIPELAVRGRAEPIAAWGWPQT